MAKRNMLLRIITFAAFLPMSKSSGSSSNRKNKSTPEELNLKNVQIPQIDTPDDIKYLLDFMVKVNKFTREQSDEFEKQLNNELNVPISPKYFTCPPMLAGDDIFNYDYQDEKNPSALLFLKYLFPMKKDAAKEIALAEEIKLSAILYIYPENMVNLLEWAKNLPSKNVAQEQSKHAEMENELSELKGLEETNIVEKYVKLCKFHNFTHRIHGNAKIDESKGEADGKVTNLADQIKTDEAKEEADENPNPVKNLIEFLEKVPPIEDCENMDDVKEFFNELKGNMDVQFISTYYFGLTIENADHEKLRYHLCHKNAIYKDKIIELTGSADYLMYLEKIYPEILQIQKINLHLHLLCYEKCLTSELSKDPETLMVKYYLMNVMMFKRVKEYEKIGFYYKSTIMDNLKEPLLADMVISLMRHKLKLLKKMIFANPFEEFATPRTFCLIYKFITLFVSRIHWKTTLSYPTRKIYPPYSELFEWNGSECDIDESDLLAEPFWGEAREVLSDDHELFLNFGVEQLQDIIDMEGSRTRMEQFIPGFKMKEEFQDLQPNNLFSDNAYLRDIILAGLEMETSDEFNEDQYHFYMTRRKTSLDYLAWFRLMEKIISTNKLTKKLKVANFEKFWEERHPMFLAQYDEIFVMENMEELNEFEERLTKIQAGLKFLLESNLLAKKRSEILDLPSIELIYQNLIRGNYFNWNKELKENANVIEHFKKELERENSKWICEYFAQNSSFKDTLHEASKIENGKRNLQFLLGSDGFNDILNYFNPPDQSKSTQNNHPVIDENELMDDYFGTNDQNSPSHSQHGRKNHGESSSKGGKNKKRGGKAKNKGGKALKKADVPVQTDEETKKKNANLSMLKEEIGLPARKEMGRAEQPKNDEEHGNTWTKVENRKREKVVATKNKENAESSTMELQKLRQTNPHPQHAFFRAPPFFSSNQFIPNKPTFEQHFDMALSQWHSRKKGMAVSTQPKRIKSPTADDETNSSDEPNIWHVPPAQNNPAELAEQPAEDEPSIEEIEELKKEIDTFFEANLDKAKKNLAKFHNKWTIERADLLESGQKMIDLKDRLDFFLNELKFIVEKAKIDNINKNLKEKEILKATNEKEMQKEAYDDEKSHKALKLNEKHKEKMVMDEYNLEEKSEKEIYFGSIPIPTKIATKKMVKNAINEEKYKHDLGEEAESFKEGIEKEGEKEWHKIEEKKHGILNYDLEEILTSDIFSQLSPHQHGFVHSIIAQKRHVQFAIQSLENIIYFNWTPQYKKSLLKTGSFAYNGHSSQSDIDGIILFPYVTQRFDKNIIENLYKTLFFGIRSECNYWQRTCQEQIVNVYQVSLYCTLCMAGAQSIRKIRSHVPLIKFRFFDVEFDMTFVPVPLLVLNGIGNIRNKIMVDGLIQNYLIYHGIDLMENHKDIRQGMLLALSGYRASLRINELLLFHHKRPIFRLVMLTLKLWAKNHFIYSGQFGFFNGIMLAVMACQLITEKENQQAPFLQILHLFFLKFSKWTELSLDLEKEKIPEIGLIEIFPPHYPILDEIMRKCFWWQAKRELNRRQSFNDNGKHSWVVLTPGFPQQNAAFNVNLTTAELMGRELKNDLNGFVKILEKMKHREAMENVKNAFRIWTENSESFEEKYGHFLVVGCLFKPNAGENGPVFCEFAESRIRFQLPNSLGQIGQEQRLLFHANPEKVANGQERCAESKYGKMFKGEEDWHCVIWLVGIGKSGNVEGKINDDTLTSLKEAKTGFETQIFTDFILKYERDNGEKLAQAHFKLTTFMLSRQELLKSIRKHNKFIGTKVAEEKQIVEKRKGKLVEKGQN